MASTAHKTERIANQDRKAKAVAPSKESEREVSLPIEEHIALLAYSYWESRGCPIGSPDEDWFRAEGDVLTRQDQKHCELSARLHEICPA